MAKATIVIERLSVDWRLAGINPAGRKTINIAVYSAQIGFHSQRVKITVVTIKPRKYKEEYVEG